VAGKEDAPLAKLSKKICLLGDIAVGKTSLVRRFVYDLFDDKYLSTIGVKVSHKEIVVPAKQGAVDLTLMIWDLAGSEEFDRMQASYLRGASGAILVCDLTRPFTLDSFSDYVADLKTVSAGAHLIAAANKRDLIDQQPPGAEGHLTPQALEAASIRLAVPYYVTSAKSGQHVEDLFRHLGRLMLENG
jgi:small GTP-binding protein